MLSIPVPDHPTTLPEWLTHAERLHPHTIDMGLDRVQQVARRMAMTAPSLTMAMWSATSPSTCTRSDLRKERSWMTPARVWAVVSPTQLMMQTERVAHT